MIITNQKSVKVAARRFVIFFRIVYASFRWCTGTLLCLFLYVYYSTNILYIGAWFWKFGCFNVVGSFGKAAPFNKFRVLSFSLFEQCLNGIVLLASSDVTGFYASWG